MTTYFADSYFFIALLNPRDAHHREVSDFTQGRADRIVTTRWILVESLTRLPYLHFARGLPHFSTNWKMPRMSM